MQNFTNLLNSSGIERILGIIALTVLLALGVGPQETEITGLFALLGLGIGSQITTTAISTAANTIKPTPKSSTTTTTGGN